MTQQDNRQTIVIKDSKDIHVENVHQYNHLSTEKDAPLSADEITQLEKELSALVLQLNTRHDGPEKAKVEAEIATVRNTVQANAPKYKVAIALKAAGGWLADLAKDTGKQLILSLLNIPAH